VSWSISLAADRGLEYRGSGGELDGTEAGISSSVSSAGSSDSNGGTFHNQYSPYKTSKVEVEQGVVKEGNPPPGDDNGGRSSSADGSLSSSRQGRSPYSFVLPVVWKGKQNRESGPKR
jgi:hypothetical protein